MKRVAFVVSLSLVLMAFGCNNTRWNIRPTTDDKKGQPLPEQVPATADLVKYMNDNAERVTALSCMNVDLGIKVEGRLMEFGLAGKMMAQQPKNFRMTASALAKDQVEIGSNDAEFWYWIRQMDPPYQAYCSYDALEKGKVQVMPLPFQPNWIMETLGMSQFGPPERYEALKVEPERLKLIEKTKSPQGVPVRKVIVFNRRKAVGTQPQILEYLLEEEATGKLICKAVVSEVQFDQKTGAVFPRRLELQWPAEKMRLSMNLNGATVNPPLTVASFQRRPLTGVPGFDMATGRVDAQANALQKVQGIQK